MEKAKFELFFLPLWIISFLILAKSKWLDRAVALNSFIRK